MTRKKQSMQRQKLFAEEELLQDEVAIAGAPKQDEMFTTGIPKQKDMSIVAPKIDFTHIGITDDRMFGTVFQNEEECKELLQRILCIRIREIHVVAQMPMEGTVRGSLKS